MKRGLLVKAVRRSPYLSIALAVAVAIICWGGAWVLQDMEIVPVILLSLGCASVVLMIGLCVYVLVARVERNG